MKKAIFKGFIRTEYLSDLNSTSNFNRIRIEQNDGLLIDLVNRVQEIKESFFDRQIQVNYWISDKKKSKDEMIYSFIEAIYGDNVGAGYESEVCQGSSLTGSWVEQDSILEFGGHNLFDELWDKEGKYLIIEFNISPTYEESN